MMISKNIITELGEDKFQIKLFKEDGVALVTTASKRNYLILDSIDYWYDLIQTRHPKNTKCKCKNEWFYLKFDYIYRGGTQDIKQVNIITKCTDCSNEKKQISIDIKYSSTEDLITSPITFCEQPYIKYDVRDINCYWIQSDLKKFLSFVSAVLNLEIYCWFWQRSDDKRHLEKVSLERANEIITVNHQYLNFYFSKNKPEFIVGANEKGDYVEGDPWRQQELIQLNFPLIMVLGIGQKGLLYYINFSTQFIQRNDLIDKSRDFQLLTLKILQWFKENYVELRGKDCFDNLEEHHRIFGNKYSRNAK